MLRARYRQIIIFFLRMFLNLILWELIYSRIGLGTLTRRTRSARIRKMSSSFRNLAVRMGGVMIKVGQFLSSRVDILPIEVTDELKGLQDEVPPEEFSEIRKVIESELGAPLEKYFFQFEPQPLAAASLGQVHRAQLHETQLDHGHIGHKAVAEPFVNHVVIKVQRPNIENIISTDLAALSTVGRWLQLYKPVRRRVNIPLLMEEFSHILYEEIDYIAEASNAKRFAADFAGNKGVRVPLVIDKLSTKRVLTLEDVWAIKITDFQRIQAAGIRLDAVASRLLDVYLQQIFVNGFFHADPHPGNLFVNPLDADEGDSSSGREWELTFVDFGMVGRVPDHLRQGLRELVIGVATRDAKRMVSAYQMMGVLLPGADLDLIEKAEAKMFERFWGKSMRELTSIDFREMHAFAKEFREIIFNMPFQVPQNLLLMVRCVGILAGMCTALDRDFNVWEHLVPFAEKLIAQESSILPTQLLEELEKIIKSLVLLPQRFEQMLSTIDRGELAVKTPSLDHQLRHLELVLGKIVGAITFGAFLFGGVQLYMHGDIALSTVFFGAALVNLLWLTFYRGRSK